MGGKHFIESSPLLRLLILCLLIALSACREGGPTNIPAVCPETLQPPVHIPPTAPQWQRSGKSSLELSLRGLYLTGVIENRIRSLLGATGTFVPELQNVTLEDKLQNGNRINVAKVRFAILVKNQDGTTTPLPGRTYTMLVEIYPQLIKPTTMPDVNLRKTLLQCGADSTCGNNGVILNFYFSELDGGPNFSGKKVDCRASGYDFIDQAVLTGAYQVGAVWAPIPIPLDGILQFVKDMTNISANINGVDLGTDQHLKLAIQLDQGNTTTFDSTFTQFPRLPDSDWLFSVDTSLLASSISSNISARESQLDPSVVPTTPVVAFTSGGIMIDGGGSKTVGVCGSVPFTFKYTAIPTVCARNGKSVFRLCVHNTQPPTPHYVNTAQEACVGIGSFLSGLFTQGLAIAVISTPCEDKANLNLQLAQDSLYVTNTDTDNQFLIIGRSRMVDAANPGRPVLPLACP
ncbi:MAG: hypothetical protein ACREBG_03805 [Pyrinomonadaceae bacterium]